MYDLIVIGAGPGGYVAAIRAAQLGFKVACVEKDATLGGTCLNVGCIPSKALLEATHKFHEAGHKFKKLGVEISNLKANLDQMMAHKKQVVLDNTKGIEFLFKKNKIDWIKGAAKILKAGQVQVGKDVHETKNILIATGSQSISLPGIEIDEKDILSSTGALALDKIPASMVVIGGGYIGLEMGSVWQRLGTKVTIVEFFDRILPNMDLDISKTMQKILAKEGMDFKLKTKVLAAKMKSKMVELTLDPTETLLAEKVLVAVGRKPYTEGLGLEGVGVALNARGFIEVDHKFQTNVPGIFAIGDVIPGPMLAHKAEEDGIVCVEMMAGQSGHVDYNLVPGVVYTSPEAAQVGQTEEQLKQAGIAYKVGQFPFMANGRARAMAETEGFVKILACEKTDHILGAHIIGPDAGTLIAELVLAMEYKAASEDIARTCHAHPTLNEVVKEACLAVDKRALHI